MKDAQKPDHVNLSSLINRLKEGRYVIPDFQREFEWRPWDIQSLMRSIFLDYYIGSLLLWKGKPENFDALSCEKIYGYEGDGHHEYIVLDGQQRLTAIYYAFVAPNLPLPSRSSRCFYFVKVDKFMNEEYDDAFSYEWHGRRWDRLMNSREDQFENHIFPLSIIGAGGWDLANWVQDYERYWQNKVEATEGENEVIQANASNARAFGQHLKELIEQYQISYIELDRDLPLDKVCDIFTQINSRGVRLDAFDLINALLKPKGLQLKHMWREASERLTFAETEKMNVYILQVMSVIRQAYNSPKYLYYLLPAQPKPIREPDGTRRQEVLVSSVEDFEIGWNQAVDAIELSTKMLQHPQEFGVVSSSYLPYVSIIPAFASLQLHASQLDSDQKLDAQRKIRQWYWASVFTKRYSGSVESTTARDYLDVKAWIADNDSQPAVIQEFKSQFKNLDLQREIKKGSSIYNGIFNLLVIQGARDWITGNIPQHDELDDHHIVPASWGVKNLDGGHIHSILNRTPLTSDTNRNIISDRLPNQYLPEMIERNGELAIREILESHFISPHAQSILLRNPFTPEDFEEFITERQRTIQDAIESLLIKERLDIPANLRDVDADVEQTELAIRRHIAQALNDDTSLLPPHINHKLDERVSRGLRKNPSLSPEYYSTLSGRMEYCDLRDLQDIITGKQTWERFSGRFENREKLNNKFEQLAELRNSIRHSRHVTEITRKEGEAAILWFKEVLKSSTPI